MRRWRDLFELAARQGGVVGVRQALALGLARSAVDDRARREAWLRPHRGVLVVPGRELDLRARVWAAVLAVGDEALVTGMAGLWWRGVRTREPTCVDLVVPVTHRAPRLEGVRVRRSRTLCALDRDPDETLALATAPRSLLDLAARSSRALLRDTLIDARQRGVVAVEDVAARARATRGVPGRGRLLQACADVAGSGADSTLVAEVERRLGRAHIAFDVPPRVVATPERVLHPDVTIVGLPVAIEVDGYGTHADRRALDLDQRKHNAYLLAGWRVLRIGWTRLAHDWAGFLAELRAAIASSAGGR